MHNQLEALCKGESLTQQESEALFAQVVAGQVDPILLSALLTALKIKGETPQEIAGAAQALTKAARPFPRPQGQIADIVGTGGDGANTINISTTSVFVAAAAGVKICKHGNRSVSSRSGSADLLKALGINIEMSPETAAKSLEHAGACFIFAPQYHEGIRHAMPVRQTLKTRTLFNLLGPLINPSQPDVMLLGVYAKSLVEPIAQALLELGVSRAMVVHGSGLDEIALHGDTHYAEINQGYIMTGTLSSNDFALPSAPLSELVGGEPEHNAAITLALLDGQGSAAQQHAIAINAGAVIYLAGKAASLKDGAALAIHHMQDGSAKQVLDNMVAISHE